MLGDTRSTPSGIGLHPIVTRRKPSHRRTPPASQLGLDHIRPRSSEFDRSPDDRAAEGAPNVGDHVKVTGKKNLDAVVSDFGKNVKSKISTYDGKGVRVVVDLTDNAMLHEPHDGDLSKLLKDELSGISDDLLPRLLHVDAVTPQGILTFEPPFGKEN
ncbi:hypothetical protein AB0L13_36890 [Saccharopolyspora shandongensis]|uniref:hypothetical protein n=1 Tax=Saccharopolyspora shandongensis TaxID=418495 RepID=UPI0034223E02